MKLSAEAKVGAVTIVAIVLLAFMVINLGNFAFGEKGYPIQAVFGEVGGLKEGNGIRYAGVDVGQVKKVTATPEGVMVLLMINNGVKIPEGSKFTIGTDGLLGEKYINITPAQNSTGFVMPNTTIRGEDNHGLEQMIASADKVLADIHKLVNSLNEVLGDEKVKASMKESILNVKQITENLNTLSAVLARMAVNNENDVNAMVSNLKAMSQSLSQVAARVDNMAADFDNNGQSVQDLKETLKNIKITSARVEKMAASLEGVVTDPTVAQNLKETLQNARAASAKADKMLGKFENINTKAGVEFMYNDDASLYTTNADVRINTSPQDFAIIGVTGIGEGSKGNFQIGKQNEIFAVRAGIVDSKPGVGIDAQVSKQMKLSADASNPNDIRVKLRAQYNLNPNTAIVGQTDKVNNDTSTYIGVRQEF